MIGYSLNLVQQGLPDLDSKILKGFGSANVREIKKDDRAGTYRAVYTVEVKEIVYVLHVFQKKSKSGKARPKFDRELIQARLQDIMRYKMRKQKKEVIEREKGRENVFLDLGFRNPEEELFKADLTAEIASLIKKRKFTQSKAAALFGVSQPRLNSLLRGRFDLFSVEALMGFLNALDQDIEVVIRPKPSRRKRAHLRVCPIGPCERVVNVPLVAKSR